MLRDYQIKAKEAVLNNLSRGISKQAVVMATGVGKTLTAVYTIKDIGRILWIASTKELIDQAALVLNSITGHPVGRIKADVFDINHKIVVASAQTLYNRLDRLDPNEFDVIVCDECDLFHARTFRESIEYFNVKLRLGLTATYYRMDNLPMEDLFDEVAFEYPLHQAVKDGWLAKPIVVKLKTSANLDNIHTIDGDFNQKELTAKVNTPQRNYQITNAYLEHGQGRQFIAFCCDVQHAQDLCEAFYEKGVKCNFVVGDKNLTPDREKTIKEFESGETTGLTNVMVLSVGYDFRDIGVCIMACPTKSKRKYIQQLGRGFRLKTDAFVSKWSQDIIIIDVVDGTSRHKLINTTELDKELSLEDKIFISDADRQKLIDVKRKREMSMEIVDRKKDEIIELFPLPRPTLIKKGRLNDLAPPSQLALIERLGYDIEGKTYTRAMVSDIIMSQPASANDVEILRMKGFDVSSGVTKMEAKLALQQIT